MLFDKLYVLNDLHIFIWCEIDLPLLLIHLRLGQDATIIRWNVVKWIYACRARPVVKRSIVSFLSISLRSVDRT